MKFIPQAPVLAVYTVVVVVLLVSLICLFFLEIHCKECDVVCPDETAVRVGILKDTLIRSLPNFRINHCLRSNPEILLKLVKYILSICSVL